MLSRPVCNYVQIVVEQVGVTVQRHRGEACLSIR
jgi:hypothetical protein